MSHTICWKYIQQSKNEQIKLNNIENIVVRYIVDVDTINMVYVLQIWNYAYVDVTINSEYSFR